MWTVYLHTCKTNSKKYVGITGQIPYTKRFNGNGSGYKTSIKFWNAIKKYGWEQFEHRILCITESFEKAAELERFYIHILRTEDDRFGYNILNGGQGGKMPETVKAKISNSSIGKPGTRNGVHLSDETKKKMSDAQKGRSMSKSHYENFCKAMAKRKGKPGRKLSDEERTKIRERSKKKIKCVETNQIFDSMTECANYLNVLISNLSRAVQMNRQYKGYHFEKVC